MALILSAKPYSVRAVGVDLNENEPPNEPRIDGNIESASYAATQAFIILGITFERNANAIICREINNKIQKQTLVVRNACTTDADNAHTHAHKKAILNVGAHIV